MCPDFNGWSELLRTDPVQWRLLVKESLKQCVSKTRESVVSRQPSFLTPEVGNTMLGGVPYGLKEAFDLKGYPTTASSRLPNLTRVGAKKDSAIVERLSELGASCVAKTQMNELAYGLSGENPHFGDCPHPTIPAAMSGGSSSGSAYLVGAGDLPLAIGTDTGGSIRVPAAWCGIYGVRWMPDYYTEGVMPLASSFDTVGWFTRSADDMCAMIRAWFDHSPKVDSDASLKIAGLRSEVYLEKETRECLSDVFDRMAVQSLPDAEVWEQMLPDVRIAFNILQSTEAYANFADVIEAHGVLLDPSVVSRIMRAKDWSEEQRIWAADIRATVKSMFDSFFADFDCLAMPICPGPARDASRSRLKLREDTLNLTALASMAGLPALAVPVFLDETRSVGIQLIFKDIGAKMPLKLLDLWSSI